MQKTDINVVVDNKLETACTDYKTIYVTIQLIPKEAREFKRVVSRVMDGQVAHESGHIVKSANLVKREQQWVDMQDNRALAKIVQNVIEDKRVNHFILNRYRFDFAHRLQLLADVSNRLWIDALKTKYKEMQEKHPQMQTEALVENFIISLSTIVGLWGEQKTEIEKNFKLTDDQKQFLAQVTEILDEARFDQMTMSVINRMQQLYNIWNTRINKMQPEYSPEGSIPKAQGGEMAITEIGKEAQKALKNLEKKLEKAEKDEEAKNKNRELKDGMSAGKGSGLNIPTPTPDQNEYEKVITRNRQHIEKLLNLLKKLQKPTIVRQRFQRQGRFMTEILGQVYASSTARNVQDIYANRTTQVNKPQVCTGLIVDLSGSVDIEEAKDSLTTISEVSGRWVKDEDFSILVFGSDYQKVKAYVEPYHTTRYRIGGLNCLGGTELKKPLEELYKMTKAQHNNRTKIIVIVSDFYVCQEQEVKKLIKQIEKDDITVVGLGIDTTLQQVLSFCKKGRNIGHIRDLPEAVFDLYNNAIDYKGR